MAHNLWLARGDKTTPTAFAVIAPECTRSVEAFAFRYSCEDVTRTFSRGLGTRAFARRNSYTDQTP